MSDQTETVAPNERTEGGTGWANLLKWSAIASIVVIVLINVFAGLIPPLVIFAVLFLAGVIWLGRATKGPAILLLVSFILMVAMSAPFIIPTLAVPASGGDFILNIASLVAAVVGIVAAIAILRRSSGSSDAPKKLGLAALGLFLVAALFSVIATVGYEDATAQEGDVELAAEDIEFSEDSLETGSGDVSVFVDNADGTLHTFTIDELDVNLDVPASSAARVTFEAEPGTYEFYCAPHAEDMKGTLTVE
jgi:plastocyanin